MQNSDLESAIDVYFNFVRDIYSYVEVIFFFI